MGKIEWDGSLAIGVKLIDDQHSMLIERLNDMTHAIESNQGPKEVARTLQFLIEYTDFHFKTEEKHMKETSFSGLEGQINAHDEFKKTLANLEGDFTEEEVAMAGIDSCKPVSLGVRVLKSDTAGLFVLSVLNYEFGM
jgi:hemerythrin